MVEFLLNLIQYEEAERSVSCGVQALAQPGLREEEPRAISMSNPIPIAGDAAQTRARHFQLVTESGLFDSEYYLSAYPDIAAAGVNPLDHFFYYGYKEGRRPNSYFDPLWYLDAHKDCTAGRHATTAALHTGWRQGRKTPKSIF